MKPKIGYEEIPEDLKKVMLDWMKYIGNDEMPLYINYDNLLTFYKNGSVKITHPHDEAVKKLKILI